MTSRTWRRAATITLISIMASHRSKRFTCETIDLGRQTSQTQTLYSPHEPLYETCPDCVVQTSKTVFSLRNLRSLIENSISALFLLLLHRHTSYPSRNARRVPLIFWFLQHTLRQWYCSWPLGSPELPLPCAHEYLSRRHDSLLYICICI